MGWLCQDGPLEWERARFETIGCAGREHEGNAMMVEAYGCADTASTFFDQLVGIGRGRILPM
jgi:hypothetical protein